MAKSYETSIFTKDQLESARTRGQVKGWIQGAVSTAILLTILNFFSWLWIPVALLLAVLGFSGYQHFTKNGKSEVD